MHGSSPLKFRAAALALAAGVGAGLAVMPAHSASAANLWSNGSSLHYWGAAGEANNINLKVVGANYVITDSGASSVVGNPWSGWGSCTTSGSTVTCPTAGITALVLEGNDMNDIFVVEASVPIAVYIYAGSGDDTVSVLTSANDYVDGSSGDDTISTGGGNDMLVGGPNDDILIAGTGNDRLYGQDGTDDLIAGAGNDQLDPGHGVFDDVGGGPGRDTASYLRGAAVDISLDNEPNDGELNEIDNVRDDVEIVTSGNGDDTLTGSASRNTLSGGAGNDVLKGGGGNDRLYGAHGNDKLRGESGDDYLDGGPEEHQGDDLGGGTGTDFAPFIREFDVFVSLDNVANDGEAGEGDNVRSDVEDITTGSGDDVVVGTNSANEFSTGAGADRLTGSGGNDGLVGGAGTDVINGGTGLDSIYGEGGADSINSKDTSKDYVSCGGSLDTVTRNSSDQIMVDCERLK